jgi:hypothetical protein
MHPYMIEQIASQRVSEMQRHANQRQLAATAAAVRQPRTPATQTAGSWSRIQMVLRHALRAA